MIEEEFRGDSIKTNSKYRTFLDEIELQVQIVIDSNVKNVEEVNVNKPLS